MADYEDVSPAANPLQALDNVLWVVWVVGGFATVDWLVAVLGG